MKSLYPMADIMTLMTKIEGNITKLGVIYTSEEARNAIDEGLIDSFVVKAGELTTAANDLKGITFAG
jgi:ABC-type uncharacterized transport system substrate-binding protein